MLRAELDKKQNEFASQMALLKNCTLVISRLLRKDESTLAASKVLVLSRLLHKHLSQAESESPLLESLRTRLVSLRRKILVVIDRHLNNPDASWRLLVDDMCAFSLTTNATPTDILRHFHNLRLTGIEAPLIRENSGNESVIESVKQLISTLRLSQNIFPKRLADALGRLKDIPLLQSKEIGMLDELNLRVHEPWIAEDLRNYTPWPRHDELREPEAKKQLKAWAQQALTSLTKGLITNLSKVEDFEAVIKLRESVFHILPWASNGLPGLVVEDVIDQCRSIFTDRLSTILRSKTHSLQSLVSRLSNSFETLETLPTRSLWADELTAMDASNGASKLKSTLRNYYQGGDALSSAFTTSYDTWCDDLATLVTSIKSLRDDRWDDDDLGEDDYDEIDVDSRRILLAEDDPKVLEDAFAISVSEAMNSLHEGLVDLVSQGSESEDTESSVAKCIVCIRVLREVNHRPIPVSAPSSPSFSAVQIAPLLAMLARYVSSPAIRKYSFALAKSAKEPNLTIKLLWEGSPALPVQPSVSAYRLLKDLSGAMAESGADIWAPGAIKAVKQEMMHGCIRAIMESVQRLPRGAADEESQEQHDEAANGVHAENLNNVEHMEESNGNDINTEKQDLARDKATQLLFDTLYVSKAHDGFWNADKDYKELVHELTRISGIDTTILPRLEKSAADYWKRTYLIFAILME
jgi:conserved oligomeric Golgi complex subunit 1